LKTGVKRIKSIGMALIMAAAASAALGCAGVCYAENGNLLNNPDFADTRDGFIRHWGIMPGVTTTPVRWNSKRVLEIGSPVVQYTTTSQYLMLDGRHVQRIRFSGQVRYENIRPGPESYDVLRAFIIWYDQAGRRIGGYDNAGSWTGSSEWRSFSAVYKVPVDTRRIQLVLGLHNCSGSAMFRELSLTVEAGETNYVPAAQSDTSQWWPYTAAECPAAHSPLDLSPLADAPAGKHGFLTARDGHFYFEDGTRARFWGFDIVANRCFPSHAGAEELADRLMRMGANIVRLHHMDAPWSSPNIFDQNYDNTRHLSADSLDRLDYFLFQLKKRGIYVYFDWLVNRKFKRGDGVTDYEQIDDGAKIVAHYNPRLIELQKEYMYQVLTRRNTYTGIRYADEPQIALTEIINEDSLFYENWYYRVPPAYLEELTRLCRTYEPDADPEQHPFSKATLRALFAVETQYYREMTDYLRSLGLRCPVTGSNHWEVMGPALLADARTDFIDRHFFWDHPKTGFGWDMEFDNLPMLDNYEDGLVTQAVSARVTEKPMVLTEWCFTWINDYIAEGPLIGTAAACLQDWDAMIWFEMTDSSPNSAMDGEFDMAAKPHLFSQWTAASLLFHRQDLQPWAGSVLYLWKTEDLIAGMDPLIPDPDAARDYRIENMFTEGDTDSGSRSGTNISSGTAEVRRSSADSEQKRSFLWDEERALMIIDSPRTIALTGMLGRPDPYDFGWVKLTVESDFCALWMTSLDDLPLDVSKRILVSYAARAENTGAVYNAGRSSILDPGDAPVLVQPVHARLDFTIPVTWRLLEGGGQPGEKRTGVSIDTESQTMWLIIERDGG